MKMSKKLISAAAFVVAALGLAAMPASAFQSVQIATITAGTTTGGAKLAQFKYSLADASNPTISRSSVTWSNVSPLSTTWKIADTLIIINSSVTDTNGGVRIYTDNTATDASPKFVDPTPGDPINPDSSASGLLRGTSGVTSEHLLMAWSIKNSTKVVEGTNVATGIGATDPASGSPSGANNKLQWLFVTDKSNWANGIDFNGDGNTSSVGDQTPLPNGATFVNMIYYNGIHAGQDDTAIDPLADGQNAYVYLQANFTGAVTQQAYQTTTLRIEAYIQ